VRRKNREHGRKRKIDHHIANRGAIAMGEGEMRHLKSNGHMGMAHMVSIGSGHGRETCDEGICMERYSMSVWKSTE
jgi:hypothetical protein